jgi:hypothetical protein
MDSVRDMEDSKQREVGSIPACFTLKREKENKKGVIRGMPSISTA